MNERIKQLAEQAEDWADNQNFYESDYRDYLMEKFAEMIVKECYQIALGPNWSGGSTRYSIAMDIKEHFGVE